MGSRRLKISPCGPDTEIFVDTGREPCGSEANLVASPGENTLRFGTMCLCNMKNESRHLIPLAKKCVDTEWALSEQWQC